MRKAILSAVVALAIIGFANVAMSAPVSILLTQGDQQWSQGHPEQAIKTYEKAVNTDPKSIESHMKLAGVLLATQNFDSAIRTYQKVLGLNSNNAKAFIGMGIAYLHGGGYDLAKAAFDEAVRLEPARKSQLAEVTAYVDKKMTSQ